MRLHKLFCGAAALLMLCGLLLSTKAGAAEPEFGGSCAMGLAEGKRIKTDCAINWTAADGKLYCFGNEDSKAAFLKDPEVNIQRARESFALGGTNSSIDDMGKYSADDVKAYLEAEINAAAGKNSGLYPVDDAMLGQTLALKFVAIDFIRTLHGYGFFPNVIFADRGDPLKTYQIDFWVKPRGGKLETVDVRVYKAPRKEGEKWVQITRQPKPWWWIPASEHPGESEVKRGWEVMSALHEHVAQVKQASGGIYKIKDDKTGEEIAMDFVGIHQPVRKLKEDGRFFACTDFRRSGSKDEYYDIDFWLDESSGKISVGGVRVHKVPVLKDGNFIQMPRYSFDPKTFDVVP
jgi:hypothetical protein